MALGEGTSANLVAALGPKVTMLKNSVIVEQILEACIPPFDKEEVDKLELDRIVSKLFYIIDQVIFRICTLYFVVLIVLKVVFKVC